MFTTVVMESKLLKEHNSKLMILVKGTRALAKGVAASLKMKSIYFTDVELLAGLALKSLAATGTDLYNVLSEHVRVWSDLHKLGFYLFM